MIKKKTKKKSLEKIGIKCYGFDFRLEKMIYCYLCCIHIKRWRLCKLDDAFKFNTYSQWKQYIYRKYRNYNVEELSEFSRYLNQKIRNIRPSREYINIFFPCIITAALTLLFEKMTDLYYAEVEISFTCLLILEIFIIILGIAAICMLIKDTFIPIKENNVEANLLKDYKEVIDEILSTKII